MFGYKEINWTLQRCAPKFIMEFNLYQYTLLEIWKQISNHSKIWMIWKKHDLKLCSAFILITQEYYCFSFVCTNIMTKLEINLTKNLGFENVHIIWQNSWQEVECFFSNNPQAQEKQANVDLHIFI